MRDAHPLTGPEASLIGSEDPLMPSEVPEVGGPVFPPIPSTTDPREPNRSDDPLDPTVPAYPAPEPIPDPAPDWLTPEP